MENEADEVPGEGLQVSQKSHILQLSRNSGRDNPSDTASLDPDTKAGADITEEVERRRNEEGGEEKQEEAEKHRRQQKEVHLSTRSRPPPPQAAPRSEPESVEQSLNARLRRELPCHVGTKWQIAQPHILRDILTSKEIVSLLKEYQSSGILSKHENVDSMCKKLRGHGHPSCIVVLAMLILVDKGYTIGDVLRDQLCDDNLPIIADNHQSPALFFWDSSRNVWKQLRCFENYRTWGVQAKLDLCKWQWFLRVPRMSVFGPAFRAYEARFDAETILPWSSESKDGEVMRPERTERIGGYSAVYKCHIDDRFHGFEELLKKIGLSGGKGFFALKVSNQYTPAEQARMSTPNIFDNERQQLNRFSGIAHSHLITLLAAFEQEGTNKNFFVFPWAECDLSAYWERPHHQDARWVSKQLVGLVGALNEIHNPAQHSQTLGSQVFGRHGDLRPENILWFTPYRGDPRGILVLSDPGFTAVNSEVSRSKQTNGKPRTPTYRPPELDINGANVTREYDVWSLGCIFLEMMTWLLGGQRLNNAFKIQRMTPESNGVQTPIFFTFVGGQPIVKQQVTEWIQSLRSHRDSTEFIHAVLDVIQDRMIIPRADRRSRVRDLKTEFDRINARCKESASYYTGIDGQLSITSTLTNGNDTDTSRAYDSVESLKSKKVQSSSGEDFPGRHVVSNENLSAGEVAKVQRTSSLTESNLFTGISESPRLTEVPASVEPGELTETYEPVGDSESIATHEASSVPEFMDFTEADDMNNHIKDTHCSESLSGMDEAPWPKHSNELSVISDTTSTEFVATTTTNSAFESGSTSLTVPTEFKSDGSASRGSGYKLGPNVHEEHTDSHSVAYSNSNLSETTRDIYVQNFAESLFKGLLADSLSIESLERVSEALTDNLKGFATRLGLNTKNQTQLDIVLFAHKHGSEIMEAFKTLLDNTKKANTRVPQEETTSNINAWLGNQKPHEESPDSPPLMPSLSPLPSPGPSPPSSIRRVTQVYHESVNGIDDDDETFRRFLEYHNIVTDTSAYIWLTKTLRRDALLQPAAQNQMQNISKEILQHLPVGRISRTSSSNVLRVAFVLDWTPWTFVRDRGLYERPEEALLGALTFTGSPDNAQALTCSDYLTQTWPMNGEHFLQLIAKLVQSNPGLECSESLPDGTKVMAACMSAVTIVNVTGVADAIAEVGQQLAWIGAALRSAPDNFEQGLCECSPRVFRDRKEDEDEAKLTFALKFTMQGPMAFANTTGSCWHSMLRNPVLVTGYPIREKSVQGSGVEMPLNIMACLTRSDRVVDFHGKMVLKGFSSMLTAVQITAEYLIWHYTFHADGTRIPFFEASTPGYDGIHFELLETRRHIVGWCSSAKCYTGDADAKYDIRSSSQPPFEDSVTLEKVSLSVGKVFGASGTFGFPINNVPAHINLDGYGSRLGYLEQEYVVLWDAEDKRGWLVNGTSALLYLVRARFHRVSSGNFRSLYTPSLSGLIESAERFHPTKSVAGVLCNEQNRRLVVGSGRTEQYSEQKMKDGTKEDTKTLKQSDIVFESFVEHFMSYLEQIKDHQTRLARANGLKLKVHVRRHLEGWDIVDLITSSNPSLRVTQLDSLGWGWVDFVRSIGAITLFGKGFGDLIKPEGSQALCSKWRTLPKHKHYLAASATDLMTAMERYGTVDTNPPQLVHGYYWHSPTVCPCSQTDNFNKAHSDPVQVLLPTKSNLLKTNTLKGPMKLKQKDDRAAFVFGHNMSIPVFWRADGKNIEVTREQDPENLSDVPALGVEELGSQTIDGSSVTSHGIQTSVSAQHENTSMSSYGSSLPQPAAPLRSSPIVPTTESTVSSSSPSRRSRLWRKDILTNLLRSLGKGK